MINHSYKDNGSMGMYAGMSIVIKMLKVRIGMPALYISQSIEVRYIGALIIHSMIFWNTVLKRTT